MDPSESYAGELGDVALERREIVDGEIREAGVTARAREDLHELGRRREEPCETLGALFHDQALANRCNRILGLDAGRLVTDKQAAV